MSFLNFPSERVIEINAFILSNEPGHQAPPNISVLEGALGRIDNAILYAGLDDVFEVASFYAEAIAVSHAFSDANKRTALAVCLEYLSLNEYDLLIDHTDLADAMVDLVKGVINKDDFADLLYSLWAAENS